MIEIKGKQDEVTVNKILFAVLLKLKAKDIKMRVMKKFTTKNAEKMFRIFL